MIRLDPQVQAILIVVGIVTFALGGCAAVGQEKPATLTVSAASNVQPAFEEIAAAFTRETGISVALNVGATGTLVQQVRSGAPADVFAAANTEDMDALARDGFIAADTVRPYAIGELVLYARQGAGIARIEDLARPEVQRIAIADPRRAPYGAAAREAMEAVGVWDAVQDRLIPAENASQALQYAETGNVDVALVPSSLTIGKSGEVHAVPADLHRPIVQSLGVVAASKNPRAARLFADFVTGPTGAQILSRYGYSSP